MISIILLKIGTMCMNAITAVKFFAVNPDQNSNATYIEPAHRETLIESAPKSPIGKIQPTIALDNNNICHG